jgi:hypothetical protein
MSYRLVREVELGSYPAGMQTGKVDRNYLSGMGNGIYFYSIEESLVSGKTKRPRIRQFVLLK